MYSRNFKRMGSKQDNKGSERGVTVVLAAIGLTVSGVRRLPLIKMARGGTTVPIEELVGKCGIQA